MVLKPKDDRRIEFQVSDLREYDFFSNLKVNYYFKSKKVELFNDFLGEGIKIFSVLIKRCLDDEIPLEKRYFEKGIGYEWNIAINKIAEGNFDVDSINDPFLLWDADPKAGLATWMYNFEGKAYLEISPEYRYNYSEPDSKFITFTEFLTDYDIVDRIELDKKTLRYWYSEIYSILNVIEK